MSEPTPNAPPPASPASKGPRTVGLAVTIAVGVGAFVGLRSLVKGEPPHIAPSARSASPPPVPAHVEEGAVVRVPGGTFLLGSTQGDADERPVTEVRVATFEIDVTEVTVGAFAR